MLYVLGLSLANLGDSGMETSSLQPLIRRRSEYDSYSVVLDHLREVERLWNVYLEKAHIPIRFSVSHMLTREYVDRMIDSDTSGVLVRRFIRDGGSGAGMMHPNQIATMVDIISRMITDPGKCILCLGAMMCGKTGTANQGHLLGPIFYLLQNVRYYPVTILPARKGHEKQTRNSLALFNALYQDIRIVHTSRGKTVSLSEYRQQAHDVREHIYEDGSISLQRYKSRIIRDKLLDHVRQLESSPRDELFERTVSRRSRRYISPVHKLCLAAKQDGFTVLLMIDEPHWGSDRDSVQDKMISAMKEEMRSVDERHLIITFDATPFQISNATKFCVVYHRLADNYCGPNCWLGRKIDPDVTTKDVKLHTFATFADDCGVPDFGLINRSAYWSQRAWEKLRITVNKKRQAEGKRAILWKHQFYQRRMREALRDAIHKVLLTPRDSRTRGICIRFLKTNDSSEELLSKMNLDPRIKVIPYMEGRGTESVEEAIDRNAPSGPYVVFVTGAARMADFFPQHCTVFWDWTETVSNHIALMQGMYGRACGYGEPRTVVMNDRSISFIRHYLQSDGKFMMKPGKQCSVPSGVRTGAPRINVRLDVEGCTDPKMASVYERIQSLIVDKVPLLESGPHALRRVRSGLGYTPFWSILNESVLEYMETNFAELIPEVAVAPRILRPGVSVVSKRGHPMRIAMDPSRPGYGKVGLRNLGLWKDKAYRSQNMREKGKYFMFSRQTDNTGRDEIEGGVQPQLWLCEDWKQRKWRLVAVVVRLEYAVPGRNPNSGEIFAAESNMWFDFHSNDQQQEVRDRNLDQLRRKRNTAKRKA